MTEVTAIIEISTGSLDGIKYEIDPAVGTLKVDRLLTSDLPYPANYGFIPNTLAPDSDNTDILVIFPSPIMPTANIQVRIIGALDMTDEHGSDIKIIAVPVSSVTSKYDDVHSVEDLPPVPISRRYGSVVTSSINLKKSIEYFFTNYKNGDKDKWVKVHGWLDADAAKLTVMAHQARFRR